MMSPLHVIIQRDADALDLPLPTYATQGAAGLDLRAVLETDLTLLPGERALVSTGIRLVLPEGHEGQVRPRSGLAWRQGVTLLNSPGTIDADYSGTIQVILVNLGQNATRIQRGDRIAQLVIAPVTKVVWVEVETLPAANNSEKSNNSEKAERGEEGFGSTGTS